MDHAYDHDEAIHCVCQECGRSWDASLPTMVCPACGGQITHQFWRGEHDDGTHDSC